MEPPSPRPIEPMAPNTSVENIVAPSPTSLKRKAVVEEDTPTKGNGEGKENVGIEKRAKADAAAASIVDLQKRRILFKQDAYPPPFPVRQMLEFQLYLTDIEGASKKVTEVPEEHWPLVFCAGLEAQCASETLLARQIIKTLTSGYAAQKSTADVIEADAILSLIPKFFTLQHYGFLPSDFASSSSANVKVPASLQIRAWEAVEPGKYLTPEQVAVLQLRRTEREKAREEIVRVLEGLDDIEKLELWKGPKEKLSKSDKAEKAEKVENVERGRESSATKTPTRTFDDMPRPDMTRSTREGTATTTGSRRSVSPVKKGKLTPEEEEAARVKKEEREAKRLAREEKKAALARETQKKEESLAKQKQKMSMFFKPKPNPASSPATKESVAGPSTPTTVKPPKKSDFERAFLPFEQRQNVILAPVNRWAQARRGSASSDFEDVASKEDVSSWGMQDFVAEHLRKHSLKPRRRRTLPAGIKSGPVHGTVQELWVAHQEAEDPRKVLNKLKNRDRFPWKTLAFDQQTRPPYCGTWTKRSVAVGPRTPFAQDPTIDYSYDSGDDWQDDEGGEDVDGIDAPEKNDEEEDDKDSDEEEGEFDDWLDDSEEAEVGPHPGSMMDMDDDFPVPIAPLGQTKLPMKVVKKREPAPKKVVKLTPFWKGPEWESEIGRGTDGMGEYRIQLLNDTPVEIDPFTYTSTDPVQNFTTSFTTSAIGVQMSVKTLLSADPVKAVAPVEDPTAAPLVNGFPAAETTASAPASSAATAPAAKPRAPPKVAFPSSHLPELLRLVDGSSKIQSDLISQLKAHFEDITSKAAIEAKIKEVCVREGKAKERVWKVKPEIWASLGLAPALSTADGPVPMEVDAQEPREDRRMDMATPIVIDA